MFRSDSLFLYFMARVCACSPAWGNSTSDILLLLAHFLVLFLFRAAFHCDTGVPHLQK